jgi:hypothetical protein
VQDDLDIERLRNSVCIRISDLRIYGMCVGILFYSPVNLWYALFALLILNAKIIWRQDGMHRKERKKERKRKCKR